MDQYLRLIKFTKPYRVTLVLAMFFMMLLSGTKGFTAYIVKDVLDGVFINKKGDMLVYITIGLIVLFFARGVFDFFQAYLMGYVGQKIISDIRNLVFRHLQMQPLSYFDKTPTGSNISRIMNDVNLVQSAVSDTFSAILIDIFSIVFFIGVVFYRDWELACITFLVLPFAAYPIVAFGKRLRKLGLKSQKVMAHMTIFLHEVLTGQRVVKAFAMEEYENSRFEKENESLLAIALKRLKVRALSSPVMELLGGIAVSLIVWYGGKRVMEGIKTPGDFFSFAAALIMLYEPVKKLNKENHNIQQALAASQRVFEVVDRTPEIRDVSDATELGTVEGSISFQDVSFKYEDKMILNNINLAIRKNEIVAIVGESGAGKTTLANLIPRFYDVSGGIITLDGKDIRNLTTKSLRNNIALVTQDTILFNDTIANNISYGPTQDINKVELAAKIAYAHDFIVGFPKGYETMVGEKGTRLSGGQKQRIAIARALYKDAPIIILDEATSSLDTASEVEVQKAFENLMKGRTTVVIAHRLSTIMNAHRIIVLHKGVIVEEGNHQTLLDLGGYYKRLYELQFKKKNRAKIPLADKQNVHG